MGGTGHSWNAGPRLLWVHPPPAAPGRAGVLGGLSAGAFPNRPYQCPSWPTCLRPGHPATGGTGMAAWMLASAGPGGLQAQTRTAFPEGCQLNLAATLWCPGVWPVALEPASPWGSHWLSASEEATVRAGTLFLTLGSSPRRVTVPPRLLSTIPDTQARGHVCVAAGSFGICPLLWPRRPRKGQEDPGAGSCGTRKKPDQVTVCTAPVHSSC